MFCTDLIHVSPAEQQVELLGKARQWLGEANNIADVLTFRDKMAAVAHFLKVHGASEEACVEASEMKVRAERKLGEMLKNMDKHEGNRIGCRNVPECLILRTLLACTKE